MTKSGKENRDDIQAFLKLIKKHNYIKRVKNDNKTSNEK